MTDSVDPLILFANEAFYSAFAGADFDAMDALWAREAGLACLHPGAAPLFERTAIMKSWSQILSGGPTEIVCREPRVVCRTGLALIVCYEVIGNGALLATNGFVHEDGQWRMVFHQAGPSPSTPRPGGELPRPGRLN